MTNELKSCKVWNVEVLMEALQSANSILGYIPIEELATLFGYTFESEREGDDYFFTEEELLDFVNSIIQTEVAESVKELVSEGRLNVFWDSEQEDFIFKVPEEAKK